MEAANNSFWGEFTVALAAVAMTLAAYMVSRALMKVEFKKISISKVPVVFTTAFILIVIIESFSMDYADYEKGGNVFIYLLGPATIAFAHPLYRFWGLARQNAPEVCAAVVVSVFVSISTVLLLAYAFGLDSQSALALTPKCVTAPVAIEISKMNGADIGLTMVGVFISGLGGAFAGYKLMGLFKVKSDLAIGLAMGATSHVIGTARCLEVSDRQAAMSALVLVLTAVFTTITAAIIF